MAFQDGRQWGKYHLRPNRWAGLHNVTRKCIRPISPISFERDIIEITQKEAIHNAKTKLGLGESTPGRPWRVRRFDRTSEAYYLIELGDSNAVVGIATVDTDTGEVGVYANLPGVRAHMAVDAQLAIELAAGGEAAQAELVWMPCSASKSPLYPLWEVRTLGGVKYVDQQRRVVDKLEPARPGG